MVVTEESVRQMVRALWLRNRPITLERLAVVRAAVDQLVTGELHAAERQRAKHEAHKLRGILGTYGFQEASKVVGEAEALLDLETARGAAEIGARLARCTRELEREG
jgi:HPt (histidine-containing phosphotransfer) domain-containing protein